MDDLLIYTTKEMVQEIYENPDIIFICVRDDFANDIGKYVSIVKRKLCWNNNEDDTFIVVPEENNHLVLWIKDDQMTNFLNTLHETKLSE